MCRLALAVLCLAALPAAADDRLGHDLFLSSCAACHGTEAKGDGPMAPILTVPVPDLTGLAARNGGAFPRLDVIYTVDGRSGLRGHGGPMPVFGDQFSGDTVAIDGDGGTPLMVSSRLVAIVDWLESVQAP